MTPLSDRTMAHLREVAALPAVVGERYEVIRELARGGMGVVYVARDRELDREVALKILREHTVSEDGSVRLLREARILARLTHPGIVPVHDVGRLADGQVYYAMKLVEGDRLGDYVRSRPGLRERLRIFERVCDAVAFAHAKGVVHRDLKPENVMVGAFGEVLVMDWGVAKLVDEAEIRNETSPERPPDFHEVDTKPAPANPRAPGQTRPGTVLGTPGYMAPEQAAGDAAGVDGRADVYALGVILRELAEGASEPVPRRLRAVADRALARDPDARYPDVPELAADVSRFLDGERVAAYREGPFDVLERWFQRYRAAVLLILAYLLARILIFLSAGT